LSSEPGNAPLIAIEGTDGCGKSTVTRLLASALENRGLKVAAYDFPDYGENQFGPLLSRFLRGGFGGIGSAEPWFVAMLFAGNRAEMSSRLRSDLDNGCYVICDRYSYSNIAFQSSKLPEGENVTAFSSWITHLEFGSFQCPRPDISFWLEMPLALRPAATANRDDRDYLEGQTDIHEANDGLQLKVHRAYEQLVSMNDDLEAIDCAPLGQLLPPSDIVSTLLAKLEALELISKPISTVATKG
jgi:dTMP kinase